MPDLRGPILQADMHHHAAGFHRSQGSIAGELGTHGVDDVVKAVVARLVVLGVAGRDAGMFRQLLSPQRIDFGHRDIAPAIGLEQQRRQHPDGSAAKNQCAAFLHRTYQHFHRQVDGV
jgi:hypothetical protein